MDIQMDNQIAASETLAALKRHKIVVGAKQLRKALCAGRASRVFLAQNADPAITEPLAQLCREHNVACAWIPTMVELGFACGIDVGAAAAAAVDVI